MQTDKTVTSSEFDRFLAERTAAAATAAVSGPNTGVAGPMQRQIDKDQEDKSLFAL